MIVFGDVFLCLVVIIYLGFFLLFRRQELLDKWLVLCRGFQEILGLDDVVQVLKQKQKFVIMSLKKFLFFISVFFSFLFLLSFEFEQFQWDRDLKFQVKLVRLVGLFLRSRIYYFSCRWFLLFDFSNQVFIWLNLLFLEEIGCLILGFVEGRGKVRNNKYSVFQVFELFNIVSYL